MEFVLPLPLWLNDVIMMCTQVLVGCTAGYLIGQVMYVYSGDCPHRFVQYAPEGTIAKRLLALSEEDG